MPHDQRTEFYYQGFDKYVEFSAVGAVYGIVSGRLNFLD